MRAIALIPSAILIGVGGIFTGQGFGYIPGSFMTGDIRWFWIGAAMVVIGLVLSAAGFLGRRDRLN